MIRSLIFSLSLIASCCKIGDCQIAITTQQAKSMTGLVNSRVVGGVVILDESSKPIVCSVCLVKVVTPAKFVDVAARRFAIASNGVVQIESATVTNIGTREYLLAGLGAYQLEVVAFDPVNGIERKSIDITMGESEPIEPPKPVLSGVAKASGEALAALAQGMAGDMKSLSVDIKNGKYKTVIEASAASNVADEQTRTTFKRSMGAIMQPKLGSGTLPTDAAKTFEDISLGFGSVK